MEYTSFWGLTAPQLVLLDIDGDIFKELVKMLNNGQDSHRLNDVLVEFDLLKKFLDETVIYEYENSDIRRKARQVKLSKEYYATGKDIPANMLLVESEIEVTEKIIATAKKRIAPYVMKDNVRIDLSGTAVHIIEFMKFNLPIVKPYIDSIKVNATKEIIVFNRRLEDIVYGKAESLRYRYMSKISQVKSSNSKKANALLPIITEAIRKDIDILLGAIEVDEKDRTVKLPHNVKVIDGSHVNDTNNTFAKETHPFIVKLDKIGLLSKLTQVQLITLANLYTLVCTLNVETFNLSFNLAVDLHEYQRAFRELEDIGLIGLNIHAERFLENSLNGIALVKDLKAVIDNSSEMANVVYEIDRAILVTNKKYGEAI